MLTAPPQVSRLVQLMQKFSKKLVSKVIYVKILLASTPDLLELFLREKGWELLNAWFNDAIKSLNWPLCAEMTQLFTLCPMTAQRLKENVSTNLAPKLIRQLSCDPRVEAAVREAASRVLIQWMGVVGRQPGPSPPPPAVATADPRRRNTRGTRSVQAATKAAADSGPRVPVIAFTDVEEIVNLETLVTSQPAMAMTTMDDGRDTQVWLGKCASARARRMAGNGSFRGASKRAGRGAGRGAGRPPKKTALAPGKLARDDSEWLVDSEDESEEETVDKDDPFDNLLSNYHEKMKVKNTMKLMGVIRNETLDGAENTPVKNGGGGVKDEVVEGPVKLLEGLARELGETLSKENKEKESVKEKENRDSQKEKERAKEREARREKERKERRKEGERKEDRKDRDKERDKQRSSSDKQKSKSDKDRESYKSKSDKEKDSNRSSSDKERDKQREERRRKEKERERLKEKERKELKEKKRESKPYRETEMRDGLDSAEKLRIRELAQKLRDESKSKMDFKPASVAAGLAKIPKLPKPELVKKEDPKSLKKSGPSFEDLMFQMDSSSAKPPIKAPPIKNKSRDLIASLCEDSPLTKPKPVSKIEKPESKNRPSTDLMKTEDKSKLIGKSSGPSSPRAEPEDKTIKPLKLADITMLETKKPEVKVEKKEEKVKMEEDKKPLKRENSDGETKLKIKSAAQLKESPMFADLLSTIIPEQPKKKKIKLEDLKEKKEAKVTEEKKDDGLAKSLADAASNFSFYRDTISEDKVGKKSPERADGSPSPPRSPRSPKSPKSDSDIFPEEPGSPLTREVRGILVLAKGPKRTRRIQWRPQESLVEIEYFELDETERVNVNKLKFEEARKNDAEQEKKNKKPEIENVRPWRSLQVLECELPEIEYGGNSNEKKEQEQRENKVLQILFFNNKLPNDPSEPDAAKSDKITTVTIPLEDTSGEEAYTDYSGEPWPAALLEEEDFPMEDSTAPSLQPGLLQNLIGGLPLPETNPGNSGNLAMDAALYAAQKAAEAELRKHGALPPLEEQDTAIEEPEMDAAIPPPFTQPDFQPDFPQEFPPDFPPEGGPNHMGFYNQGPPVPWHGPPNFHNGGYQNQRGGPYNRGGPPNPHFRGGFMHGGGPMRGFPHNNGHNNGYHGGPPQGGWGGRKEFARPCKFWMEKGYCREEARCKFPHPQGR